jgi:preprotein translocase subunit SecG
VMAPTIKIPFLVPRKGGGSRGSAGMAGAGSTLATSTGPNFLVITCIIVAAIILLLGVASCMMHRRRRKQAAAEAAAAGKHRAWFQADMMESEVENERNPNQRSPPCYGSWV